MTKSYLRPKVFHCVKLGNETQVLCPAFALVVFEIPQGPSERGKDKNQNTQYAQDCGEMTKIYKLFFFLYNKTTREYFP